MCTLTRAERFACIADSVARSLWLWSVNRSVVPENGIKIAGCWSSVKDCLLPSAQARQTLVLCFKVLILFKMLLFISMWTLRPGQAPNVDLGCLLVDQNSHWLQEELTRDAELSPSAMKASETVVGEEMSQRVTAAVWLLLSPLRAFAFDLQIVITPRMWWKCIYFFFILKPFATPLSFRKQMLISISILFFSV